MENVKPAFNPTGEMVPSDDGNGYVVTAPLFLTTDIWAEREDPENEASPIEQWVMEHSINGFSLGFDYSTEQPDVEAVRAARGSVAMGVRDAVRAYVKYDDEDESDVAEEIRELRKALVPLKVNLIPQAHKAMEDAADLTGLTRTDVVNRALQVYSYWEKGVAAGGTFLLKAPDGRTAVVNLH